MKAVILQTDFNKWLTVVGRVVPNRGQLPVLANVLLEAEKGELRLTATNLEIGLRVVVGGKVTETGAITIPAKSLAEFVGSIPAGNVEIETSGEKMKVSGGKMSATFTGIAATEFPVMPGSVDVGKGKSFKLKKKLMEEIATQVAFAAAADESRPVLTGVMMQPEEKGLVITATDGFRLSRKTIAGVVMGSEGKGLIIPARTMLEMARVVGEGKKEELIVGLLPETNQVVMEYDGVEMLSRVLEGNFPDVEKIIPRDNNCRLTVDREEMLRAVRAAGIFARESANVVKFKIEDTKLTISASATQTGESEMEMEVEKKGEDGQIAFNYRYVLDYLNSVNAERVTFGMTESLAPGVFGVEGDPGLTHIIMPVRV